MKSLKAAGRGRYNRALSLDTAQRLGTYPPGLEANQDHRGIRPLVAALQGSQLRRVCSAGTQGSVPTVSLLSSFLPAQDGMRDSGMSSSRGGGCLHGQRTAQAPRAAPAVEPQAGAGWRTESFFYGAQSPAASAGSRERDRQGGTSSRAVSTEA